MKPFAPFRLRRLAPAALALAHASTVFADTPPVQAAPIILDDLVVTATRTERSLADTPATVSVVTFDSDLAANFADVIRGETLVAAPFRAFGSEAFVPYQRGGYTSYNVRGIEGNRVLIQVDGVRAPDEFSLGGSETTGRDYFDVESFKRLEILQGSASALFGSDALGGVFTFQSKDPADYLAGRTRPFHLGYKAAYSSVNNSFAQTATAATQAGPLAALLVFTRRTGHETENQGAVAPNPEDFTQRNLLAKLVWSPTPAHRLAATVEHFHREQDVDVNNLEGNQGFLGTFSRVATHSDTERFRVGLDYGFTPATATVLLDRLDAKLYAQDAVSRDANQQLRAFPSPRTRDSVTAFNNDTTGGSLTAQKSLTHAAGRQRLLYGMDFSRTDTDKPFTRLQTTTVAALTDEPRMADTVTRRTGFFLQDEIDLRLGGADTGRKLGIIPGVRVERFELTPDNSPAFLATTAGQPAPAFRRTALTPKLGLLLGLTDTLNAYASYNRGFRYPNAEELTATFTNVAGGYKTLPNPELRAEVSDSFEAGVKGRLGPALTLRATAFHSTYTNFISQFERLAVTDPAFPVGLFQTRNMASARIYGGDLTTQLDLGKISPAWTGFSLQTAVGYSKGDGRLAAGSPRVPLNSIEPLKANAAFAYHAPRGRWSATFFIDHAQNKTAGNVHQPEAPVFRPPSYTVFDLTTSWRLSDRVSLHAGFYNLADKKYWRYSAIRNLTAANATEQERRTEPGFNSTLTLQFSY